MGKVEKFIFFLLQKSNEELHKISFTTVLNMSRANHYTDHAEKHVSRDIKLAFNYD